MKIRKGLPVIFGVLIMVMVVLLMASVVGPVEIVTGSATLRCNSTEEAWRFMSYNLVGSAETPGVVENEVPMIATQTPTEGATDETKPYPGPTVGQAPTSTQRAYPGPTEEPTAALNTPVPRSIPPTRPAYPSRWAPSPFPSGTPGGN